MSNEKGSNSFVQYLLITAFIAAFFIGKASTKLALDEKSQNNRSRIHQLEKTGELQGQTIISENVATGAALVYPSKKAV